ncbi:MAG: dTDP-4-dehydrorhamnose reductase [Terriglobia bacterium]
MVTGGKGMLGRDVAECLAPQHQVASLARSDADITDPDSVMAALEKAKPDVVIHTAAFTAVDECELRPEQAFLVNAEGTRHVAEACARFGTALMLLSTDYVFGGEGAAPYEEDDAPGPINQYGRSKLAAEKYVQSSLEKFWIVRVSWLFGPRGRNFVKAILAKAAGPGRLAVVDDQFGSPTYTWDAAEKIGNIVTRARYGIYHVTNQGYCSWFDFAKEIISQASCSGVTIDPVPASAVNRPAPRPRNSRLANVQLLREGLGLLPSWQDALSRYLRREDALL